MNAGDALIQKPTPRGGVHDPPSAAPGAEDPTGQAHAALAQLALDLGSADDITYVYRRLCRYVREHTPMSGIFVSHYDHGTKLRTCVFAVSEDEELDATTFPAMPSTGSPHSRAVESGETFITKDFQEAMAGKPRFNVGLHKDPRLPQSSIVVPMLVKGRVQGAMEIQSAEPNAFQPHHVAALQMAAHMAALAVENVERVERERRLRSELEVRAAELEDKVRARVRELAAKNRELEAFSFTAAHDLRAPLRAVLNLSEDVLKSHGDALPDRARLDLQAIHQSSEKMTHLVEDLLQFARTAQGPVRRELVNMSEIARQLLDEVQTRERSRKHQVHVQDNLFVEADPALVRILLDNLISNAWKYSSHKPVTTIRVGAHAREGELSYFVEDAGIGFEPHQATRLFSAFTRLHSANQYEGTGIGLATAQRIVERHGGRIWADARPGEGATFHFTLRPSPGGTR